MHERPGPFATVLVDVSLASDAGPHVVETLAQSIGRDLDVLGAPPSTVELVRDAVAAPTGGEGPRSRFVAADAETVLVDELLPVASAGPVVEWAPLPDPGPLLRHEDRSLSFVLVAVDHEGGDVGTVVVHGVDEVGGSHADHVGRGAPDLHTAPGGAWSHLSWRPTGEHRRRGPAKEVADAVREHVAQGCGTVVVAGDAESRGAVVSALADAPTTVLQVEHTDHATDGNAEALRHAVRRAVAEHLAEREERRRDLVASRARGEDVARGVEAVARALAAGRTATVALDPAVTARHSLDPGHHPGLDVGAVTGPVRADLALLAAASRTGTGVLLVDDDVIGGHGAVAIPRHEEVAT